MSNTHAYLTRRLGTLRAHTEGTQNEINRLLRQREAQTAELAQVEAALAAVDALAERPDPEPETATEPEAEIDTEEIPVD